MARRLATKRPISIRRGLSEWATWQTAPIAVVCPPESVLDIELVLESDDNIVGIEHKDDVISVSNVGAGKPINIGAYALNHRPVIYATVAFSKCPAHHIMTDIAKMLLLRLCCLCTINLVSPKDQLQKRKHSI